MNDKLKAFLFQAYEGAERLLAGMTGETVSHKSANDLLTKADLALNDYFVRLIEKEWPEAAIIAEESENAELTDRLTFVVDPLDGTCNFARGVAMHGIQIAVFEKKECVASLVGLPKFGVVYYAEAGQGCFRNGKRIHVDPSLAPGDGILSLSDFYHDEPDIDFADQFALVASLQHRFLKTRLYGASCFDFAALVENQSQAYVCYYRHIWDIAPGLLLAKEAGAKFARLNGKPYRYGCPALVVANAQETLDLILKAAKPFCRD